MKVIRLLTIRIKGIGGKRGAIDEAEIQIPFKTLGIRIEVKFIILDPELPTLLSTKDLWTKGLDI